MSDKPDFEEEVHLNRFGFADCTVVMTRRVDYTNGEVSLKIGPGFVPDKTVVQLNGGGWMARQDSWVQLSAEFVNHSLNEILKRQELSQRR